MTENEIVKVRGFDLFFHNASWLNVQDIASALGGNSSFDPLEQRATYMFEKARYIELGKLSEVHDIVNQVGESMAEANGCNYVTSELYLTTNQVVADWLEDNDYEV